MERELELELLKRCLGHVRERRTEFAAAAHECPTSDYIDEARHHQENAVLFRRFPVVIGHISQIPAEGDFLTHEVGGVPILVVRQGNGGANAFINVCRHRGALLVEATSGHCEWAFSCPYHAWSYDQQGQLVAIPSRQAFAEVDPARRSLVALPCAVAHGLIYVVPSAGPPLALETWLGEAGRQLCGIELEAYRVFRQERIAAGFNWKVGVDGALELYHFPTVHKDSGHRLFASAQASYENIDPHARLAVPRRSIADLEQMPPATWRLRDHALLIYFLFPNTVLLLSQDHAIVFSVEPAGAGACDVRFTLLVPAAMDIEANRAHWERTAALSRRIIAEDFAIGEGIQRALASGANQSVTYGRNEPALADFHRACERALAAGQWNDLIGRPA